jgi:hypothetical protein
MQYEEKSNLENRISAHFDGSLDRASSNALLDEVMASPEKRALFRAHETLNSVIAAARVPMEAPLETKREIAAFIPGLLGTAETMPILQQSTNPFISFFARMSLQTAVSIGSAVAVLVTAGIIVNNNLDNNATQTPKIAAVQNAAPQASANAPSQQYAMAPSTTNGVSAGISKHTRANVSTSAMETQLSVTESSSQENVQENVNAPQVETPVENDNAAPVSSAFDAPKSSPAITADIPVIQPEILMPTEDEVSQNITVRPFASYGTRYVNINNSGRSIVQDAQGYAAGVNFEIGDRYAFRAQFGRSEFAQVFAQQVPSIPSLAGPIQKYEAGMDLASQDWTTVGMSYSFATPLIPIIAGVDAGAVWSNSPGIMVMASIATEIPVSGQMAIRPSLTYDVVGTSTALSSLPNGIYESPRQQTMWASAFGFQLNFMFRP